MKINLIWNRRVFLSDGIPDHPDYLADPERLPETPGIYVFGRQWGKKKRNKLEALYVGKADNLRRRIKGQFNNYRLRKHLKTAKSGKRFVLVGEVRAMPGQNISKTLLIAERAVIRYFLLLGHDLINKKGTKIRQHTIISTGKHPKRFLSENIYLEKGRAS